MPCQRIVGMINTNNVISKISRPLEAEDKWHSAAHTKYKVTFHMSLKVRGILYCSMMELRQDIQQKLYEWIMGAEHDNCALATSGWVRTLPSKDGVHIMFPGKVSRDSQYSLWRVRQKNACIEILQGLSLRLITMEIFWFWLCIILSWNVKGSNPKWFDAAISLFMLRLCHTSPQSTKLIKGKKRSYQDHQCKLSGCWASWEL